MVRPYARLDRVLLSSGRHFSGHTSTSGACIRCMHQILRSLQTRILTAHLHEAAGCTLDCVHLFADLTSCRCYDGCVQQGCLSRYHTTVVSMQCDTVMRHISVSHALQGAGTNTELLFRVASRQPITSLSMQAVASVFTL